MKSCWILALLPVCACGDARVATPTAPTAPAVPSPFTEAEIGRILRLSPLGPAPTDPTNRWADDEDAAQLGQFLFFDERLSRDGDTSCATCHDPAEQFTDRKQLAEGLLPLERHTPSIWNIAFNRWFFWDGRADSSWAQALTPLESPLEHASSRLQVAHVVRDDGGLSAAYEKLFGPLPDLRDDARFPPVGRPVPEDDHAHKLAEEHAKASAASGGHTHGPGSRFYHPHQRAWDSMTTEDQDAVTQVFVNVGKAIAAYERKIVSRHSAFDRFVEGLRTNDADKLEALDPSARNGLQLFLGKAGCNVCHDGPNFTDREFHDLRLPPAQAAGDVPDDPGRTRGVESLQRNEFNGVGRWSDDPEGPARYLVEFLPQHRHGVGEFKTPSLRNVAVTAPYMHQGQFETLGDVLHFYSTFEGALDRRSMSEKILQPLDLTEQEQQDIVHFLESLTDVDIDARLMRAPDSPSR